MKNRYKSIIAVAAIVGICAMLSPLTISYGETPDHENKTSKTSEIVTAYGNIAVNNAESIQWINLREELVMIHTTSVDDLFERGYLIKLDLYLKQKNSPHIRIFDPFFDVQPLTEAESLLLGISNPNDEIWNDGTSSSASPPAPPPNAGGLGGVHEHASILVKIFGDKFDFTKDDFQIKSSWIHFEGRDGDTIHRHATGVELGFLFDSMGIRIDGQCFVFPDERKFCTNNDYSLKFYLNGEQVQLITDHIIINDDRILISYGPESAEDISDHLAELNSQKIFR